MNRRVRIKLKWFSVGAIALIAVALILSGVGLIDKQAAASDADWSHAAQSAPSELLEQIRTETLSPNAPVDVGRMKVWKVQQSGQTQPLYLIDSRVTDSAERSNANPLCGSSGCAFFGYLATMNGYQQVLNVYLDPRLPPNVPLIELGDGLQAGLPVLKVNQLEGDRIQLLSLSFNGQKYEIIETQLLPQRYEQSLNHIRTSYSILLEVYQ
jgi:hypothetical protein